MKEPDPVERSATPTAKINHPTERSNHNDNAVDFSLSIFGSLNQLLKLKLLTANHSN